MIEDKNTYLDLQPPEALACRERAFVFAAPGNLGLPGSGHRSVPLFQTARQKYFRVLRMKKDKEETERRTLDL